MRTVLPVLAFLFLCSASAVGEKPKPEGRVTSETLSSVGGQRMLVQTARIYAPIEAVWAAYTTEAGWTAWASPHAAIDLRCGGSIRTHYAKDGKVGDPGTNTLRVVNLVPRRLLTLQAQPAATWPAPLRKVAPDLSNAILFERVSAKETRVTSYGLGYGDGPAFEQMLGFFARENVKLLEGLLRYVEQGTRRTW